MALYSCRLMGSVDAQDLARRMILGPGSRFRVLRRIQSRPMRKPASGLIGHDAGIALLVTEEICDECKA